MKNINQHAWLFLMLVLINTNINSINIPVPETLKTKNPGFIEQIQEKLSPCDYCKKVQEKFLNCLEPKQGDQTFYDLMPENERCFHIFCMKTNQKYGKSYESSGNLLHALALRPYKSLDFYDKAIEHCLYGDLNINQKNYEQRTPLHIASECSNILMLRELIAYQAKLEEKDSSGRTALLLASDPIVIKMLVVNGAKKNAKDADGNTLLHKTILQTSSSTPENIKYLHSLRLERNKGKKTPLQYALQEISLINNLSDHERYQIEENIKTLINMSTKIYFSDLRHYLFKSNEFYILDLPKLSNEESKILGEIMPELKTQLSIPQMSITAYLWYQLGYDPKN